jgi:hypothetical protein
MAFTACSFGLDDLDRLVELERQDRLRRYSDRSALSEDLSQRAGSCSRPGPDGSTFPAARDGTDDGADSSGSA